MSEFKLFYTKEDVEEAVLETKIVYFLMGAAIGALTMFIGLITIGVVYGI